MNIEEKAKAYDNIIEKANKMHSENCEACQACIEELIPELKESEDEKIRKSLLKYLHTLPNHFSYNGSLVIDWIVWLEKQSEQENKINFTFEDVLALECSMKIAKITKGGDELYKTLVPLYNKIHNAYLFEKQGEQKPVIEMKTPEESLGIDSETYNKIVDECVYGEQNPAEWHREDEQNLNACLGYIPDEFLRRWLQDIIHAKYDKPAWSEEDEHWRQKAIDFVKHPDLIKATPTLSKLVINWLKSLRPQPKQEWNEEDDRNLSIAIQYVFQHGCLSIVDWLKSLKDRCTWKPSNEQMEALNYVVNLMASSKNPTENKLYYNILKSLRQQLKKLRDE